jgi:hypothetical protein
MEPTVQWIAEPLSRCTKYFLQSSPHDSCRPPPTKLEADKLSPLLTSLPPILQSRSRPAAKRRSHVLSCSEPYTRLSPIASCHHASFLIYAQRQQSCSVPYTQIYNVSSKGVDVTVGCITSNENETSMNYLDEWKLRSVSVYDTATPSSSSPCIGSSVSRLSSPSSSLVTLDHNVACS